VSILAMHGTDDAVVRLAAGEAAVQRWKTLNGCVGDPTVMQRGITTTSIWNRCNGDAVVRFDKVVGGRHTWFGSAYDPVPGEPNANADIWDFFSSLPPRP
jgi:poly(3-hydroxybutyrate) depolymerase